MITYRSTSTGAFSTKRRHVECSTKHLAESFEVPKVCDEAARPYATNEARLFSDSCINDGRVVSTPAATGADCTV